MGANSTQAAGVLVYLLGFTFLPLGLATGRVIYYLLAIALVALSVGIFLKCKPLEYEEN
jgi:hypothetical protein